VPLSVVIMAKQKRKVPWNRDAPAKAGHVGLTPAGRAAAKKAAKRAGRPYPNLVDNMRAATKQKKARKKASRGRG
jgi:hypothetical protein